MGQMRSPVERITLSEDELAEANHRDKVQEGVEKRRDQRDHEGYGPISGGSRCRAAKAMMSLAARSAQMPLGNPCGPRLNAAGYRRQDTRRRAEPGL